MERVEAGTLNTKLTITKSSDADPRDEKKRVEIVHLSAPSLAAYKAKPYRTIGMPSLVPKGGGEQNELGPS